MLQGWMDRVNFRPRSLLLLLGVLSILLFVLGSSLVPRDTFSFREINETSTELNDETAQVAEPNVEQSPDIIEMPELQKLCQATTWQPGLYHVCDDGNGGIGNMMSFMLACTRYSIEAGAAMTLPKIKHRGTNLADLATGTRMPFSYFFSEKWYIDNLAHNCPQLQILQDIGQVNNFADAQLPGKMEPSKLRQTSESNTINRNAATFREDLMKWLKKQEHAPTAITMHSPVILRTALKAFEWTAHSDGEAAWIEFGKLLRWREDIRDLAKQVYQALHQGYPESNAGYLGAHLRTEDDVKGVAGWSGYEQQRDYFLEATKSKGMSLIYVASGSAPDIERLTNDGARDGITVLTKLNLLDPAGLDKLGALSWDQQAMVDYLVLRSSAYFIGFAPSSFAFALAYARHLNTDVSQSGPDDTSRIVGTLNQQFYQHGMWPSSETI